MSLDVELLETSFAAIQSRANELSATFYRRLFAENPAVRPLFRGDARSQERKLAQALAMIVKSLRAPEKLERYLLEMGREHVAHGAQPAHYPIVGRTLLEALADVAGPLWSPKLEKAWSDAYGAVSAIMLRGAAEASAASGGR